MNAAETSKVTGSAGRRWRWAACLAVLALLASLLTAAVATRPVEAAGGPTFTQITGGSSHTCAIDTSGAVWCWGLNQAGELGDGTTTSKEYPTPTGLTGVSKISAGDNHTCAVKTDGRIWCWGKNTMGQVGDGTVNNRTSPVLVSSLTTHTDINAGGEFTCAIRAGTVWCWGRNAYGQVGDNSTTQRNSPTQVAGPLSADQISLGYVHACSRSGTAVKCWGRNNFGQLGDNSVTDRYTPVSVSGTYKSVNAATGYHTCAIDTTDSAMCWGRNTYGQLGEGSLTNSPAVPTAVLTAVKFSTLTGGSDHTCGRSLSSQVYCWGRNDNYGQLGDGTNAGHLTPELIANQRQFSAAESGDHTVCAITTSGGYVYCWGRNHFGQVGDGTFVNRSSPREAGVGPTRVNFDNAEVGVAENGGSITIAVNRSGDVSGTSTVSYATANGSATAGSHYTATSGTASFSASQSTVNIVVPVTNDGSTNSSRQFTLSLSNPDAGTVVDTPSSLTVTIFDDDGPVRISAGTSHSCAVNLADQARCWGANGSSQLGDGTTTQRLNGVDVTGASAYMAISAGSTFSCGLTLTGRAYCWGTGSAGELGTGALTASSNVPVLVSGNQVFQSLVASESHTCALTTLGAAYCWGVGTSGQLGDGSTVSKANPTLVTGGYVYKSISSGNNHSCAVTTAGAGYCWGANGSGQLGDGTTTARLVPTGATGGYTFASTGLGTDHSCGVLSSNALRCWGENGGYQLGDNSSTDRSAPTLVNGNPTVGSVTGGGNHSCAIATTLQALCWGTNGAGQLGDGSTTLRATPVSVAGGFSYTAIDAGSTHTCAVRNDNEPFCWGDNTSGQIGDGTTTARNSPRYAGGIVDISVANASLSEGQTGGTNLTFTVSLSAAPASSVTVAYATSDGTARAGNDYKAASGSLTIPAGSTSGTVDVLVYGDNIQEPDETLTLTLSAAPYNGVIVTPSATGTIQNDDVGSPSLSFAVGSVASGASCNGATSNVSSTGTGMPLGAITAAQPRTAIQNLQTSTSLSSGYTVNIRYLTPLQTPVQAFGDVAASSTAPANFPVGVEAFGYTTGSTTLSAIGNGSSRFSGGKWAGLTTGANEAAGNSGSVSETTCVALRAAPSLSTPAGNYNTVVVYTAIPRF